MLGGTGALGAEAASTASVAVLAGVGAVGGRWLYKSVQAVEAAAEQVSIASSIILDEGTTQVLETQRFLGTGVRVSLMMLMACLVIIDTKALSTRAYRHFSSFILNRCL